MSHDEIVRQIHDAAVELGAECLPGCAWNADSAPSAFKSVVIDRAKAMAVLAGLTN